VHRTLTWGMGTKKSITTDGGEELEVTYLGEEFYTRLGQQIGNELNTKRWAGTTDIIISCAGRELSTFIDVNTPTNSIVQEVPEYTNIENGFGIFSSRKTAFRTYKLTVQSELKLVENYNWGFELKLTP
ncbi:MAG: hypothetical protein Q8T08_23530, partial [Ignavibacteria bacterium]|nr:hypothetical protein [Ignavibacteria bacterium]